MQYFTNNFGKPAGCHGRAHVDSMLCTFQRIQEALFGAGSGGAGGQLKKMISARFGVRDLPDGYLYFPQAMGGLGLQNPFVELYLIRNQTEEDPEKVANRGVEYMQEQYELDKDRFEESRGPDSKEGEWDDLKGVEFMSYDEYVRFWEWTSKDMLDAYTRLM